MLDDLKTAIGGIAIGVLSGYICNELLEYNPWIVGTIVSALAIKILSSYNYSYKSYFDNKTKISGSKWAVTLIRTKGCINNHAEIIIEGNENQRPFMKYVHFIAEKFCVFFSNKSKVDVNDIDPSKLLFISRSKVFSVPYEKGKKIISLAELQRNQIIEVPKFNVLGSNSIFSRKDSASCISWALETLEIADIKFEKNPLSWLVLVTEFYTPIPHPNISKSNFDYEYDLDPGTGDSLNLSDYA